MLRSYSKNYNTAQKAQQTKLRQREKPIIQFITHETIYFPTYDSF